MANKTNPGNFFEDFSMGQVINHATPRTVTEGDVALYTALFGSRFAVYSSDEFARKIGLERAPIDDVLAFHIVFGTTVPDISLNAVANLGYAAGTFGAPVYPGDTLTTKSQVIGLRQNKDGKSGIVYVRSTGENQHRQMVIDYCRWVMVRKKDESLPAPEEIIPELPKAVDIGDLVVPYQIHTDAYDLEAAGSTFVWEDYEVGEKIDHVDGMTIEEAEHMMATRLYQNTAKVHFDEYLQRESRFGRRLIYGGHVISLARALSFNGLANGFKVVAFNGGAHTAPTFAGDTIYCWSEVLDKNEIMGQRHVGTVRLRTMATKNQPCGDYPYRIMDGKYDPSVVLDFDYTVLMPKRT
jgi:2-methylfumaryl-CoA hydratase